MLNGKLYINRLTYQKTGDKIASTNNKHTDFEKKWFLQENQHNIDSKCCGEGFKSDQLIAEGEEL